jgi:cysteinyl-tRNA synthetase
MSKSLGKTLWAMDVLNELGTNLTRWLVSSVHYRKELNFSDETIATARREMDKVMKPLAQASIKEQLAGVKHSEAYDEEAYRSFLDCMDDDMNTPNAYAVIFDTVKKINQGLRTRDIDFETVDKLCNAVEKMLIILGITVENPAVTDEDRALFARWNEAKQAKDFAAADAARKELTEKGLL